MSGTQVGMYIATDACLPLKYRASVSAVTVHHSILSNPQGGWDIQQSSQPVRDW